VLAKQRKIFHGGQEIGRTPMLVPSFSSKGVQQLGNAIKLMEEFITGPVLISSYDLIYGKGSEKIKLPITFPELVFLDSGGYEASKDHEELEPYYGKIKPKPWNKNLHKKAIDQWKSACSAMPTVLTTFDHPKKELTVDQQIKEAKLLFEKNPEFITEILLKPEQRGDGQFVEKNKILAKINEIGEFDVIGFAEKELGRSILDRMVNLAIIRRALTNAGIEKPIHLFGNLDSITTPLYFMSGADIFDGLTWLRYAFTEESLHYQLSYGATQFDLSEDEDKIATKTWVKNLSQIILIQSNMKKFAANNQDHLLLGKQHEFFKQASNLLASKLAEVE
jgi:hypothetical protein